MTHAHRISAVIRLEMRELWLNKPFALFIMFGPLLFSLLMAAIFSQGIIRSTPIAVWDADNSAHSRELVSMLEASPYLAVTHQVQSSDEGMHLIRRGDVYGMFIIPENFSADLLGSRGAVAAARYNNQYLSQGGVLNKAFAEIMGTFAAKYDGAKYMAQGIPPYALEGFVQPVSVRNILLYNNSLDYSWFLLMGILPVIWQLFGIGAVIYILARNLALMNTTLINIAKSRRWWLLTSTLMPHMLLFLIQFIFIEFIMFGIVDVPLHGSRLPVTIASFLFITATMSVGALLVSIGAELGRCASAGSVYVSPAFSYAGIAFPYEAMPAFAQFWSEILPITHYHRLLVDIALRNVPIEYTLSSFSALAMFTLVCAPPALFIYRWRLVRHAK